ncbi:Complement C3 [Triplophysa tibetana]|uniref:Complement C3 n=1 Tax=Triplophysa tibetana TaxID=1572043 RepID=A0A5A9PM00_9TELE|nr:Complement C3 [Triplophysa tibetana]
MFANVQRPDIPVDKNFFSDDPLERQYVVLQAHLPLNVLEKVVMVSFQSGYIFVQTDKPIYTPASTGLKSNSYPLPEIVSFGVWKLVAKYKNTPQKNFTTEFEVTEYVLPSFEVTLKPSKPIFFLNEDLLTVDIAAKYLFGNKVTGSAFVVFGVLEDERKSSIGVSLQRVQVYVTNPDQTPAVNLQVEVYPGGVRGHTKGNGIAKATVNSQGDSATLEIILKTKVPQLEDDQQAVKKMTAHAYKPKAGSHNYLHVGINAAELEIGDQMKVNLNLGKSPAVQNQDFSYMILSRGQIVKVGRYKRRGQPLVTLSLPVTKDMVPSFRFVAYYHVGSDEGVFDSVLVDVKDTCMGKLKIEVMEKEQYGPDSHHGQGVRLVSEAPSGAVALGKNTALLLESMLRRPHPAVREISHKEREGIAFRIHKMNEVGMLQPAGVTLYEYNSPENCSLQKRGHIDEDKREEQACVPEIEYVYKARVKNMDFSQHSDIYNMTIEQVLKEGNDRGVEGNVRSFLAHPHCRDFLKLEEGKMYLIMGQTKPLPPNSGRLRYHVGEDTWIESYRAKYIGISSLANKLVRFRCTT